MNPQLIHESLKRSRALIFATVFVGFCPIDTSAQSAVKPSSTSAMLDDLRNHARSRQVEFDNSQSEVALDVTDESVADGAEFPLSDAANQARNQYYNEAQNALGGGPGSQQTTSFDDVYRQRLAERRSGWSSPGAPSGGPQTGYSYSEPYRRNYFPSTTTPQDRNFSLGPMDVRFGARMYAEYNDNIRSSSTGRLEDVVVGTMLDIGGTWQLTEGNRIDLNLGLGIERYLQHQADISTSNDEFNLIVSPNSVFSFDFFIGNMLVNIHDRLSVQNRGRDDFTLDDLEFFSQWQNEAGISAYLPLNEEVDVSLSYDFLTIRSLEEDRSEFLDRNTHRISASTSYSPDQFWRIGLESSASFNRYETPVQNDSNFYSLGLFFETPITEFTELRIDGGYQFSDFSDNGVGRSSGRGGDYYGSLTIANVLNSYYSHDISLGHETNLGILSDTASQDFIRYSFSIDTTRNQTISGSVYYEIEDEAGGTFQEDSDRYGASLAYNLILSENLRAGVRGNLSRTDSELQDRGYDRWSSTVDLTYSLSEKLELGLAYTHSETSTGTGVQDYKQNRVTLDLNYRF